MDEADFDEAVVSHPDGRRQTMTKVDYYRQSLKARVEQLCKGQARFFYQGQPVSPLKATKRGC